MNTNSTSISTITRMRSSKMRFLRECTAVALSALMLIGPARVYAGPSGGTVAGGSADINTNGSTTTINQHTDKAIINWQKFGIGADELVQFNQLNSASVILNRVTGGDASQILGALQANGRVFILNTNGILFGANSRVDVAGLMATTLSIRDEDFMAGKYNFTQDPAAKLAYVINHGRIVVGQNGFAYLVAPGVENSGIIVAKGGQVALASGKQATIDFTGDNLVKFQVSGKATEKVIGPDGQPMSTAVLNTGTIHAAGGHVMLSADTARDIVTSVVNNTGVIEATSLADLVGSVAIEGRGEGDIYNTGLVNVSSDSANTRAGTVTITGENIANLGAITANAATQGDAGNIDIHAARVVVVGSDATITANAAERGNAGSIALVGEDFIRVATGAALEARGGSLAGNGGFIETSGYNSFEIGATPDVSAAAGRAGTWLLDPADIEIVAGSTITEIDDSISGIFTSTANTARIGATNIINALATGNVTIATGDYGDQLGNIILSAALSYAGLIDRTLTLNAHNDIILNAGITSSASALSLTLNAGNDVALNSTINTNGGALTITNAGNFTYANAINTGAGNITINTGHGINIAHNLASTGVISLTATTGNIAGAATITASTLNLTTLGAENASIGSITRTQDAGGNDIDTINALKIKAGTLNASTQSSVSPDGETTTGNILLEHVGTGDLVIGTVTTNGNKGDTDLARVVITATIGTLPIYGNEGGTDANIDAFLAIIRASGYINLTTNLSVLDIGTTMAGSIAINNLSTGGLTILNATAREYGNLATLDAALNVKAMHSGTYLDGLKDVTISSLGNIALQGAVSATRNVTITSADGSIYNVPTSGATITSSLLTLNAGKAIGQNGNALSTITGSRINAEARDGGVYLAENNRLNIGVITAAKTTGTDNNITLSTNTGNAYFGDTDSAITATGGTVSITAAKILAAAGTSDRITADAVSLKAGSIGASGAAIKINAAGLKTAATTQGGATYVANSRAFSALDVTTDRGLVSIASTGANLNFALTGTTGNLALTNGAATSLAFTNASGNVTLGGIDVGANAFSLTADSITQNGSTPLIAGAAPLNAATNIGTSASRLVTQVASLDLTSGRDGIYINQTGALTLNASATGANSNIDIAQANSGDLTIKKVTSANGSVTLGSAGSINAATSGGTHITGTSISLTAAGSIGSGSANPINTRVTGSNGALSLSASGGIAVENTGAITLDASTHDAGDIYLKNTGDINLSTLNAGTAHNIALTTTGKITDANADTLNITASNLALKASSIGTSTDALETNVGTIDIEATNGGLYLKQIGATDLYVAYVKTFADTSIETGKDLYLGVIDAGKNATIKAAGKIRENRVSGDTRPNIKAETLTLEADELVGDTFKFNVQTLDSNVATGSVSIENMGALHVTKNTIENKANQTVSIKASTITIFDNNGGTTSLGANGSLELIANAGNIVFLNTNDTIEVQGNGTIKLQALGSELPMDPETGLVQDTGLVGIIVAGNLKADTGDISLEAYSHISINVIETKGDVLVASTTGLILDGNGAANNITARNVTLRGKSQAADQPGLDLTTAKSGLDSLRTQVNNLKTLRDLLALTVATYTTKLENATRDYNNTQSAVDGKSAELESAERTAKILYETFYALDVALSAAGIVLDAMEIPTGAAQAVPLVGDGGSGLGLAIAKLAKSVAETAAAAASRAADDADNKVDGLEKELIGLEGNLYTDLKFMESAQTDLTLYATQLNNIAKTLTDTIHAQAASQQIHDKVATVVYNNAKLTGEGNVIGLKTQALGVQAGRVDATAIGQSNIYITSPGALGAGDINAGGDSTTVQLTAKDNLNILGKINASKDVFLYSKEGAITGSVTGTVATKDLAAIAANGIGMTTPVNTQVERIAAKGGASGVKFVNDTGVETLTIDELIVNSSEYSGNSTITGITGAGDILVKTAADLHINKSITDTTGASKVILEATGGSITGATAITHVVGGTLFATASTGIGETTNALRTDIAAITGTVTGAGLINLDEKNAIELTSLYTTDGYINLKAAGSIDAINVVSKTDAADNTITLLATAGDIKARTITAGATTGTITLKSTAGQVNNDGDIATKIAAQNLVVEAFTSIGAVGTNANTSLDTTVENLWATTATGVINITETDDLNIKSAVTGDGNVTITSTAGSLNVTNVTARADGNTVTLDAKNAITDATDDSTTSNVNATNLALIAGTGIGSATNALDVTIDNLEAKTTTGGVYINDLTGGLNIGGVTPGLGKTALTGITVGTGDIIVTTTGNINVNEAITTTAGNISLTSTSGNLVISDSIATAAGNVNLDIAAGNITGKSGVMHVTGSILTVSASTGIGTDAIAINTTIDKITGTNSGNGGIYIQEKDTIELSSLYNANGLIKVGAGADIDAISVISATDAAGNDITLTATTGNITAHTITTGTTQGIITLTAHAGQVNNDKDTATKIIGRDLNIVALSGIGVDGDNTNTSLDTVVTNLTATTDTGAINIAEADDLNVKSAVTGNGDITITSAAGSLNVTTITASTAGNTVTLDANKSITDAENNTASNVNATNLALIAGTGIGAVDNHFDITVDNIEALTNTGGVYLNDLTGGLAIGGVTPGLGKPALTGITATSGNIVITTPGDLRINESITALAGDVTLNVVNGSVTGTQGITHVTGSNLTVTASTGIGEAANPLKTDIAKITGTNTGTGVISILEKDAIELTSVYNTNGPITVEAGGTIDAKEVISKTDAAGNGITLTATSGNIIAGIITAGTTQGIITLEATKGAVNNDKNTASKITGRDLIITASTGIGVDGDNTNTSLDTVVTNLWAATGTGAINISEADDLNVKNVATSNGDVTISSAAGSLNVTTITATTAGNTVTLDAKNAITDAANNNASNVTAANLALIAGTGIGAAGNFFDVTVDNIEAKTNTGGVYINDLTGGLAIGGVTPGLGKPALTGITVGTGGIVVTTTGNINVNEAITTNAGDISLTSTTGNLVISASIATQAGNVDLDIARGSVTGAAGVTHVTGSILTISASTGIGTDAIALSTGVAKITGTNSGTGLINIAEKDAVELTSLYAANGPITVIAGGSIDAKEVISALDAAGNTIALTSTSGTITVGNITAGKTNGDITLSAAKGAVINDNDATTLITGHNLAITASTGIAAAANALQADVAKITGTNTGSGVINITEKDAVELNGLYNANGWIQVVAGGDINAVSVISKTDTLGNNITLTATSGNITAGIITAGTNTGTIALSSAKGRVNNDGNTATKITGDVLTINALGGIGAVGTNANTSLDTEVNTLVAATATGPVNIAEANDLNIKSVTTGDGNVTIASAAGSLNVTNIAATGAGNTVTLKAANAITDATTTTDVAKITAAAAALIAGTGIGAAANVLEIAVDKLEATATTGGIYINDLTGDLAIGGVTPGLGIADIGGLNAAAGPIAITTAGSLTVNEAVLAAGDITNATITGSGKVALNANAALAAANNDTLTAVGLIGIDSRASVLVNGAVATAGSIDIDAAANIVINASIDAAADVNLTAAAGSVTGATGITHITGSTLNVTAAAGLGDAASAFNTVIAELNATITGLGVINVAEKDGLALGNLSTANGNITVTTQTGNIDIDTVTAAGAVNTVKLDAIAGAIAGLRNDSAANITADRVELNGAQGIGADDHDLNLNTGYITAHGGSGGVHIANLRQNSQLGALDTDAGDISYTTIGRVEVTGSMTSRGGGDIRLATTDSGADNDDIVINIPITTTGDGSVRLNANDNVYQNANMTVANKGNVEVTAGNNITMGTSYTTTADLGHITYTAGNTLILGHLAASTIPVGGTITITAPNIVNSNTAGVAIDAAFIHVNTDDNARRALIEDLTANDGAGSSAIWLNQRLTGGLLSHDATIIGQPRAAGVIYSSGWRLLRETGYKSLIIDAGAYAVDQIVTHADRAVGGASSTK